VEDRPDRPGRDVRQVRRETLEFEKDKVSALCRLNSHAADLNDGAGFRDATAAFFNSRIWFSESQV
jgi:hypothetical protein